MKNKYSVYFGFFALMISNEMLAQNLTNQPILSNGSKIETTSKHSEENNSKPVLSTGALNSKESQVKMNSTQENINGVTKTPEIGNMKKKEDTL